MNEHHLIISSQKGEKEALQSLIDLYYPYVSKFLLKLCGNDLPLSQDLTQETFLKLIQKIDRFDVHGKAGFSTYVMAIAKNCYIDHWRRNRESVLFLDESVASRGDLQDEVWSSLQTEAALRVLDRLPAEQSAAIKLKYLEDQTLQEIAAQFGCETKTVKSRIHNGMTKLRRMLKGDF